MNDRLPYEEQLAQQWNDLPLPDENMAWADMKRRLEEEDEDSIIPFWLRGCGLWGLLFVVLLGFGWWLFRQDKQDNKKEEKQKMQNISQQETGLNKKSDYRNDSMQIVNRKPDERSNGSKTVSDKKDPDYTPSGNTESENRKHIAKRKSEISVTATNRTTQKTKKETPYSKQQILETKNKTNKIKEGKQIIDKDDVSITSGQGLKKISDNHEQLPKKNDPGGIIYDSSVSIPVNAKNIDTARMVLKDSVKKKIHEQTVKDNVPKKDSSKLKSISFSAGIAMHQLLPIDGQKLTPYNSLGRKSSLADYIPSVFVRMYKDNKWFLQSEFRYGAPQYTREILYRQKGVLDTSGNTNTITSTKLKKTFYHQLPVTFNYFVLPNWSVGSGLLWNKFSSAVSEQDVIKRSVATGADSIISLGTILSNRKADSNFVKSYFQAVLETQYRWKRFSLGARYSFGLQPYLKFNLPGGTIQNEKNKSLQVFLRYELWKSKTMGQKE